MTEFYSSDNRKPNTHTTFFRIFFFVIIFADFTKRFPVSRLSDCYLPGENQKEIQTNKKRTENPAKPKAKIFSPTCVECVMQLC